MTSQRTYQIIIAILVIVILAGGWIAFHKSSVGGEGESTMNAASTSDDTSAVSGTATSAPSASNVATGSAANTAIATTEAVSVSNQPAGMSVAVSSVSLNQLGWVAIRDSSGRTLGAALFSAGSHSNVEVPLLRATAAGERYQVLLYVDDGDKQFDLQKDALLTGTAGEVVGTTFTAN